MFAETDGLIAPIQDQLIAINAYRNRILGQNQAWIKCPMCGTKDEYIEHIMAECTTLAYKTYVNRRDRMGKIIY